MFSVRLRFSNDKETTVSLTEDALDWLDRVMRNRRKFLRGARLVWYSAGRIE